VLCSRNFKHVTFLTFSLPFASCIKPLTSDTWDLKYSPKSVSRSQSCGMCHVAWQKSTNVSQESADFFISTGDSPLTGRQRFIWKADIYQTAWHYIPGDCNIWQIPMWKDSAILNNNFFLHHNGTLWPYLRGRWTMTWWPQLGSLLDTQELVSQERLWNRTWHVTFTLKSHTHIILHQAVIEKCTINHCGYLV
jgi:hypothetical protein